MNKIIFILMGILVLCSVFMCGGTTYPAPTSPVPQTGASVNGAQASNIQNYLSGKMTTSVTAASVNGEAIQLTGDIDCNEELGEEGCYGNGECFKVGARKTINYKELPSWVWKGNIKSKSSLLLNSLNNSILNKIYLYCGKDYSRFSFQKITEETCEYDFECESNVCNFRKCLQKSNIDITKDYDDRNTIITNLFFPENETFYFQGLTKTYLIGFGKNDSDFIFFTNNKSSFYENKTLIIDNYSQFIFNSIILGGGITSANVTFIESKNPINDSKKLIEQLTCEGLFVNEECKKDGQSFEMVGKKYIVEDKSLKELSNEEISAPITGGVIETKGNLFSKIWNFFKGIFKGSKNG